MKKRIKSILPQIGDKTFVVLNYTFFILFAISTVFPLYYIYINALSDPSYVTRGEIFLYPKGFNLSAIKNIFTLHEIGQSAINSVLRTVLGVLVSVTFSAILGYVFTKQEFKYRKFWYRYFILTMYVGAGLIPGYLNLQDLGFLNSFWWIYIAGGISQAYNMILVKTYMESLPASLEEAAYIDGAGYFKRFVYVVIPLSKPILATIAVFVAVAQWNSYMDTLLYMTKGGYPTLQSTLYKYLNQSNAIANAIKNSNGQVNAGEMIARMSPLTVKYAITAVTLTPVLVVYPFFQRFFTKGIMIGAVKG